MLDLNLTLGSTIRLHPQVMSVNQKNLRKIERNTII